LRFFAPLLPFFGGFVGAMPLPRGGLTSSILEWRKPSWTGHSHAIGEFTPYFVGASAVATLLQAALVWRHNRRLEPESRHGGLWGAAPGVPD